MFGQSGSYARRQFGRDTLVQCIRAIRQLDADHRCAATQTDAPTFADLDVGRGSEELLEGLPVFYLSADFGTVARRIGLDRPRVVVPGNPRGRLRTMLDERDVIYQRLAAITVPTDDLDPGELADRIAAEITTL